MYRQLRGWLSFLAVALVVGTTSDVYGYPYLLWTGAMSSSHSSDLGGYPAQNAFAAIGRSDWSFEAGSAQGAKGFSLRDDFHGNWHSGFSAGPIQSPSGATTREWIAADFGAVQTIYGADIWNTNWDVINLTRGIKNMSIDVSVDNVNWTTVWSGDLAAAPGVRPDLMYDGTTFVNPSLSPGHAPQFGLLATDSLSFGGPQSARYVVLNMNSNQGNDAYFAIEEVKFVVVPEPGSLLLTLFGLAFGIHCRRR